MYPALLLALALPDATFAQNASYQACIEQGGDPFQCSVCGYQNDVPVRCYAYNSTACFHQQPHSVLSTASLTFVT